MGWFAIDESDVVYMFSDTGKAWTCEPDKYSRWHELEPKATETNVRSISLQEMLNLTGHTDFSILVQTGIDIRDFAERQGVYFE